MPVFASECIRPSRRITGIPELKCVIDAVTGHLPIHQFSMSGHATNQELATPAMATWQCPRNFNPDAVQFSTRSLQMALTRRAEHFEMEEGRKYFYGIRTKTNYRKAFPLLLAAARRGYVHAQYLVGYAYRDGLGTEKDLAHSRKWWAASAKRGHPGAMFNLALDYDLARGVRRNPRKAFVLYQRAAKLGDREAQCNLAHRVFGRRGYEA